MKPRQPEGGASAAPAIGGADVATAARPGHAAAPALPRSLHYVGDPMCSWCWGLAPALQDLSDYCAVHGIGFSVTVGGLRAGGGAPWSESFRTFLRRQWQTIGRVTGQPFGFTLLDHDHEHYDYDTEPACRAVVAMASLMHAGGRGERSVLAFFTAIQRKFYVQGDDPKDVEFYRSLCEGSGIRFEDFRAAFRSEPVRRATLAQFEQCRRWGVRGFPCILIEERGRIGVLAAGYVDRASLMAKLHAWLGARPAP